jgi:predicted TIM-barrel fold metal-dependent hydrolase
MNDGSTNSGERYIVVSADSHCGPTLEGDLRAHCPPKYRDDFEQYCRTVAAMKQAIADPSAKLPNTKAMGEHEQRAKLGQKPAALSPEVQAVLARTAACPGQADSGARLADMDADGVAANVIFAGGGNGELMAFLEMGLADVPADRVGELRAAGNRTWNHWLAELVSDAPTRHIGVMEVPIWDVDVAVREVEWGHAAGLKAVNLPAPRTGVAAYNDPSYEPFFATCEALGLPVLTHIGGGDPPLGGGGPGGFALSFYELQWLSRRALWQLIMGGVFERHPGLNLVFVECGVGWIAETLSDLDSFVHSDMMPRMEHLSRLPSEYWATNCAVGGSFLAPFEVARRDEVGLKNMMWGSDYPHPEGAWPHTRLSMRNTFSGVPEAEARQILGLNAIRVFSLDEPALRAVADQIGPTPAELATPLAPDEWPAVKGMAFREHATFA